MYPNSFDGKDDASFDAECPASWDDLRSGMYMRPSQGSANNANSRRRTSSGSGDGRSKGGNEDGEDEYVFI